MTTLEVQVRSLKDKDNPDFPYITDENYVGEMKLHAAAVLEAGTLNKETSVSFIVKTNDDKYILVQTTGAILKGLVQAIQGAEQFWADRDAKKN